MMTRRGLAELSGTFVFVLVILGAAEARAPEEGQETARAGDVRGRSHAA
jgi:hypothetical protein